MRYRSRRRTLSPVKGQTYFWLVSWHLDQELADEEFEYEQYICDDLSGGRTVNPLFSYQPKIARRTAEVKADDGYGRYYGSVGIDSALLLPALSPMAYVQDLNAWATRGANRVRAIKPYVDAAVEVGEAHDYVRLVGELDAVVEGVKSSAKSKRMAIKTLDYLLSLKGVGDVGLGVMFGLMPLLDLVRKLLAGQEAIDARIRTILQSDGKWQHRRVVLLDESTTTTGTLTDPVAPLTQFQTYVSQNTGEFTETTREHIWYETDIKYVVPGKDRPEKVDYLQERLFSTQLTGETLYELSPYSWLADWFLSAGAFIENSMDHTLYRWRKPCLMYETSIVKQVRGTLVYHTPSGLKTLSLPATSTLTVKRREPHYLDKIGFSPTGISSAYRQLVLGFLALKSGG